MTNIHLEPLGNGMEIFVSDSYHFSTDTILLADFSQPANGKRCADLGTGCGTIPLLWLKRADTSAKEHFTQSFGGAADGAARRSGRVKGRAAVRRV